MNKIKVILRKNLLSLGYVNSAFIRLQNKKSYSSVNKLIDDLGWQKVMSTLYNEDIESSELKTSSLYKSYENILHTEQNENNEFIKCYKISDFFAVSLDSNIYLLHLFPKGELCTDIVPWYYADSKKYLGDTWWETDDEILNDLNQMPIIDFLDKYKGYM